MEKESVNLEHGPYGEKWFDDREGVGRWRLRLTEDGKQFVEDQLAKWGGKPSKLLWKSYPSLARFATSLEGTDAVQQHCRIGFVIAAIKYRPERGEFSTIAVHYLRRTVQLYAEDLKTGLKVATLLRHRGGGKRSAIFVRGCLDDPDKFHVQEYGKLECREPEGHESDRLIVKAKVEEWLGKIPKRHAHVTRQYIMGERTLQDIGDELGVSKERVRQIVEKAKHRLGYVIDPSEYQKVVGI